MPCGRTSSLSWHAPTRSHARGLELLRSLPQTAFRTGDRRVPIAAEPVDQLVHIERPEALADGAPRADAVVVVDEIAERFDDAAGHAGKGAGAIRRRQVRRCRSLAHARFWRRCARPDRARPTSDLVP